MPGHFFEKELRYGQRRNQSAPKKRAPKMGNQKRNGMRLQAGALAIDPVFCPADVADPFDTVEWDTRTAAIKGEDGEVLFEQTNCEMPAFWSQLATNVVVSKYFYGENGTPEREHSVRQLIHRVSRTIADWGIDDGYFATRRRRRAVLSRADLALPAPARRVQFARLVQRRPVPPVRRQGRAVQLALGSPRPKTSSSPENPYEYPQGSACFIQSVNDNMEDIMELARSEAMLFKFGSGTGTDLSTLRSHREKLSGGGKPSGPAVVHAGLRPDCRGGEERRQDPPRRQDAVAQGLAPRHHGVHRVQGQGREEGPHADRKGRLRSQLQRRSLQLDPVPERQPLGPRDRRVHAGRRRRTSPGPRTGSPSRARTAPRWPARDVLARMAECAWHCGDPGVQYDTTINRWHTCPNSGRINAINPCSRVHVPRRHGLQPGQHQPDEVPPATTARSTSSGSRPPAASSSSPRKSWSITPAIRPSGSPRTATLPPAGLGLLEPRQPDHVRRHGLRLATRPAACAAR